MIYDRFLMRRETEATVRDLISGVPIYSKCGELADKKIVVADNSLIANGTSCRICITRDNIFIRGKNGTVIVKVENHGIPTECVDGIICGENMYIQATSNGVVFFVKCAPADSTRITVITDIANQAIRKNNKYVAFLEKPFTPSITIAALYSVSEDGKQYRPLMLESKTGNVTKQEVRFSSLLCVEHINVFEINLREPKMIQDTTVESASVTQNNVYGATAFVGRTEEFGEQWLYLKTNIHFLKDIKGKLLSAKLHIPIISGSCEHLQAFLLMSRFCSFGSNWNNKLAYVPDSLAEKSSLKTDYVTFDITRAITEGFNGNRDESAGILIMNNSKKDCAVLATGDCYAFPQLLEVMYM